MIEILTALEAMIRRIVNEELVKLASGDIVAEALSDNLDTRIAGVVKAELDNRDKRIDDKIDNALRNCDFGDAIDTAIGDYDFDKKIEQFDFTDAFKAFMSDTTFDITVR